MLSLGCEYNNWPHRYEQCITRDIWQEANQSLNAILESRSLADMKNKSNSN